MAGALDVPRELETARESVAPISPVLIAPVAATVCLPRVGHDQTGPQFCPKCSRWACARRSRHAAQVASQPRNRYLDRPAPSSLADVIDTILDKGLVIDIYVRVSLVGIELLPIYARIVIASVDTYLRFAEAVNRLDLTQTGDSQGLPELVEGMTESGAKG